MARETIKGRFVVQEHEEWGTIGFRPEWMPHSDPLMALGVAHDLLEHRAIMPSPEDDDGSVEAELQALGASYFIRGETGYMQRNGNVNPPEDHIAADFIALYHHIAHEGFTLLAPTDIPTEAEHQEAANFFHMTARRGQHLVREEESYSLDADEEPEEGSDLEIFCLIGETTDRLAGWMLKGYVAALDRFSGVDPFTLAHSVFGEIERRCEAFLKGSAEEGMVLDVEIDLDRLSVSMEAGYGVEESDYCDDCDGTGKRDGADEGNYHDCPRALDGCNPADPSPDCPECEGNGYVTPPVTCDTCEGSGEVDTTYREPI